jgi:hypothetical protein
MSFDNEIQAYNAGTMKFFELSEGAREELQKQWRLQRLGWDPDFTIRVAGVTMTSPGMVPGHRQAVLAKIQNMFNQQSAPAVRLTPQPSNPYDKFAVQVEIATVQDSFGNWTCFEDVGFLPRGQCQKCGEALTGKTFDNALDCPECGNQLRTAPGIDFIDPKTNFNKYYLDLASQGKVAYAADAVLSNSKTGKGGKINFGLRIAFKLK